MEVAGRTALVTGAGVGTGRAIARALAAAGARLVVSDVDAEGGERTAAECGARFLPADLTVPDDVRRLVEDAAPEILVNNAGGGGHIPPHFPAATPEPWGATLDLNLRAPMLATQCALAVMRPAGDGASVPPPIPLATITDALLRLIADDTLAGRAIELWRGEPSRLV